MNFWLTAAAMALAGGCLGSFLKKRLCLALAGLCGLASAGLYLWVRLFVHHNGMGAGLGAIAIWLFSTGIGLFLGHFIKCVKE